MFYPRAFKERFAESMEQTFNDLCAENRQTKHGFLRFVIRTFVETGIGVFSEHVLLVQEIYMKALFVNIRSSGLIGLLVILPFIVMEIVNRRQFNEDFPFVLFIALWINVFAVSAILLPILQTGWMKNRDRAGSVPEQANTLLRRPWPAVFISIAVCLAPGMLPLLDWLGWLSVDRLFNGPTPEVEYLPGLFLTLFFILFPVAAGIIAGMPIVDTLRSGGRLFAHPVNLIIVILISFTFAAGVLTLVVDQWPCFMGVPNCD
jgi:hypothetical protein